jgi:hypothetical protein
LRCIHHAHERGVGAINALLADTTRVSATNGRERTAEIASKVATSIVKTKRRNERRTGPWGRG